ncbi:IS200/IS605 family transposase [Photobacterium chitinilyticum]|uniref:IS200/IS605 family transposase n=1 Tax=Photobacterium chitinilyticum TaxID=2485123 RepID=A0A444JNM3_9GAMM|nr:IS200/IS605 family transposase [Photobacterium chitinilyticum]RWX54538.1 IS200/IS605 family transposase [Photobacterium chitinilyticum]
MRDYKSLSHTRWDCKYHIVFIPKKRQKVIFGAIRKHLGDVFHELARRQGIVIEEGHLMKDHVHMCLSIPPKLAVSHVVGYMKGKSAISIARNFKGKQRNFTGESFWARGYFVSTIGLDEEMVRAYIQNQEEQDCHRDQLKFGV